MATSRTTRSCRELSSSKPSDNALPFSSASRRRAGLDEREFLVLAAVNEMRFLAPVFPGQTMILEISIVKMLPDMALVEGIVTVEDTLSPKVNSASPGRSFELAGFAPVGRSSR